jgi:hypothetical protein
MIKKIILLSICFFIFSFKGYSATESIELTTYYPAPYGDYENMKTNTLDILNIISNPVVSSPESIDDFNLINFNKGLRIFKEIAGPYYTIDDSRKNANDIEDVAYSELLSDRLSFKESEGENKHEIVVDSSKLSIIDSGDIYLKPGDGAEEESEEKNVIIDSGIKINGAMEIKAGSEDNSIKIVKDDIGDILIENDNFYIRFAESRIEIRGKTEPLSGRVNDVYPGIIIKEDGVIRIEGDLEVSGNLSVKKFLGSEAAESGNIDVTGDLTVNKYQNESGDVTINGNLKGNGNLLTIDDSVKINKNLTVEEDVEIEGNLRADSIDLASSNLIVNSLKVISGKILTSASWIRFYADRNSIEDCSDDNWDVRLRHKTNKAITASASKNYTIAYRNAAQIRRTNDNNYCKGF